MTVESILKSKGRTVATTGPTATVRETVATLASKRIGALVVTGADDRIVGIVSERDVVRAVAQGGEGALDQPVSLIMTRGVVTTFEGEKVVEVMRKMTEGRFRHVPVVADGHVVGLISIGDVVKHRIGELESEAAQLRDYIHAG